MPVLCQLKTIKILIFKFKKDINFAHPDMVDVVPKLQEALLLLQFRGCSRNQTKQSFVISRHSVGPENLKKQSLLVFRDYSTRYFMDFKKCRSLNIMVDVAQLVRAPDCGSGSRGFEPHLPP
jgi:hypothetical protein